MSGGYHNPEAEGSSFSAAEMLWVQTGAAGILLLKEQASTPSPTLGYGKLYTKISDDKLYYLDENGVEFQIGLGGGTPVYEEIPSGSGTAFTLAHTPIVGTVRLYRGGARQAVSAGDYSIVSAAITLSTSLSVGETLIADYSY